MFSNGENAYLALHSNNKKTGMLRFAHEKYVLPLTYLHQNPKSTKECIDVFTPRSWLQKSFLPPIFYITFFARGRKPNFCSPDRSGRTFSIGKRI